MKEPYYIKGVGMTRFGYEDQTSTQMIFKATKDALLDADLTMAKIDAVVISNMDVAINGERQRHMASVLSSLFKARIPIIRTPAVCGGGGAALWNALHLGYDNMLVIGAEKISGGPNFLVTDEILMASERIWEQAEGMLFPVQNALVAQSYFAENDATIDDLSLVALKNHENAFHNPKAFFYKRKVDLDMIQRSPVVASPLRLFDCSISVNGAAAVVISKDQTDVQILGSSLTTDYLPPFEREKLHKWDAMTTTAEDAYKQAGLTADDISFAELHDAFTILELMAYEACGFCMPAKAADMIRDGVTTIDGKLPVNTSGGLKAKGHPISATGVSQIVEITNQLRQKCDDRQVSNPKYALAQNIGGAGGTVSTHIFGAR